MRTDYIAGVLATAMLCELERECDEHGPKRHRRECLD